MKTEESKKIRELKKEKTNMEGKKERNENFIKFGN